jgi:hypothetical protein
MKIERDQHCLLVLRDSQRGRETTYVRDGVRARDDAVEVVREQLHARDEVLLVEFTVHSNIDDISNRYSTSHLRKEGK